MNDGMYVCFTKSCPADALGDWNILIDGVHCQLKLNLGIDYTVAKSMFCHT